jgi:DNA-directed RNA polymerase subunit RPC12/RpoP
MKTTSICSICKDTYDGWGNNAYPVNDGRCCDKCNMKVVVPARIARLALVNIDKINIDKKYKESKLDHLIVCQNCGHIQEMHDWDDYDGWSCTKGECKCQNFKTKIDKNNNVVYEEGE